MNSNTEEYVKLPGIQNGPKMANFNTTLASSFLSKRSKTPGFIPRRLNSKKSFQDIRIIKTMFANKMEKNEFPLNSPDSSYVRRGRNNASLAIPAYSTSPIEDFSYSPEFSIIDSFAASRNEKKEEADTKSFLQKKKGRMSRIQKAAPISVLQGPIKAFPLKHRRAGSDFHKTSTPFKKLQGIARSRKEKIKMLNTFVGEIEKLEDEYKHSASLAILNPEEERLESSTSPLERHKSENIDGKKRRVEKKGRIRRAPSSGSGCSFGRDLSRIRKQKHKSNIMESTRESLDALASNESQRYYNAEEFSRIYDYSMIKSLFGKHTQLKLITPPALH
jgi:hypothetical protein